MAGIFSLIYFGLVGASALIEDTKIDNYKADSKRRALENGELTYMDGRGNEYFVKTDTMCEKIQDANSGHWILREINSRRLPTGRVLHDFDKYKEFEKRNELSNKIALAKKRGQKYVSDFFIRDHINSAATGTFEGYDIEKERRYIIYKFGNRYYCTYMQDKPVKYKECCNFTIKEKFVPSTDEKDTFPITKKEYYERFGLLK